MTDAFYFGPILAARLRTMQGHQSRQARSALRRRAELRRRLEATEAELGRVALFAHALVDLCVSKGLLTRAELVEAMRRIDPADGVVDGRLDLTSLVALDEDG